MQGSRAQYRACKSTFDRTLLALLVRQVEHDAARHLRIPIRIQLIHTNILLSVSPPVHHQRSVHQQSLVPEVSSNFCTISFKSSLGPDMLSLSQLLRHYERQDLTESNSRMSWLCWQASEPAAHQGVPKICSDDPRRGLRGYQMWRLIQT